MLKYRNPVFILFIIFFLVASACQLPQLGGVKEEAVTQSVIQPTAAATAEIAASAPLAVDEEPLTQVENLPPVVVETKPLNLGTVTAAEGIKLYFSQPMDKASVESALSLTPELDGQVEWLDETTLNFLPSGLLPFAEEVSLFLDSSAMASNGLFLQEPFELTFSTPQSLQVLETIPDPDNRDVDPSTPIVVTFNNPVVPLSAARVDSEPAFYLDPPSQGTGEWLNTSTYIFYPDPPLLSGMLYSLSINGDLQSLQGGGLSYEEAELLSWTFTTAEAEWISIDPLPGNQLGLDGVIKITFNQPMDTDSFDSNLYLIDADKNQYSGSLTWNEAGTEVEYQSAELLPRAESLTLVLSNNVLAKGGKPILEGFALDYVTSPRLSFTGTDPDLGGGQRLQIYGGYSNFSLTFSTNLDDTQKISDLISIEPTIGNQSIFFSGGNQVMLSGYFSASTFYTVTISGELHDDWGGNLGQDVILSFRTQNADPELVLPSMPYDSPILFLTTSDSTLTAQATNLNNLTIGSKAINFQDFITYYNAGFGLSDYAPEAETLWTQPLNLTPNHSEVVKLPLNPDNISQPGGLYYFSIQSPEFANIGQDFLAIVSDVHLVIKRSQDQMLVWAVDMQTWQPLFQTALSIYDKNGSPVRSCATDENGVCTVSLPEGIAIYDPLIVMAGQPGEAGFGLTLDNWSSGISGWDFDLDTNMNQAGIFTYLYTDRPIYKAGQTVNFRLVLREKDNGRYSRASLDEVTVKLVGYVDYRTGKRPEFDSVSLPLSVYGSAEGSFKLPEDLTPGDYQIIIEEVPEEVLNFQVAEYRKPEIELNLNFDSTDLLYGEDLQANLAANYYFGAPGVNLPVHWTLYARSDQIVLPYGYSAGISDFAFYGSSYYPGSSYLGNYLLEGDALTGTDGLLALSIPFTDLPDSFDPDDQQTLTLEMSLVDESGLPVSVQAETILHQGEFNIGIRPDLWVGQSGTEMGFAVQTLDWENNVSASRQLQAKFYKVTWVPDEENPDPRTRQYVKQTELVDSAGFTTDLNGQARLSFTPPEPGNYELEISAGRIISRQSVWVGGEGRAVWPNLPDQKLQILSDAETYQSGDAARLFFPNPFEDSSLALVTVERGEVMRSFVIPVTASNYELSLPLTGEDAPNVFVSIIVLGENASGISDFRMGYVELKVEPREETLKVELISDLGTVAPGEEVTLMLQVKDYLNNPVKGEFSLSLVDMAVLALAEPNAPDILDAFYAAQPLGIRNSLSLVAHAERLTMALADGVGGGGGPAEISTLREDFKDTAYWNGVIETDENGLAEINVVLPDNLTTWVANVRGLTQSTLVGEAEIELLVTKNLLIRPVVPAFLVEGDHIQLVAVVQNNSDQDLSVEVNLEAVGVELDEAGDSFQRFDLPSGSQQKVTWWGRVNEVGKVDLVFNANAGEFNDRTRPANGSIPVLHYSTPQTFGTSGVLVDQTEKLEVVSLPRTMTFTGGNLLVELAPSLAAEILSSLDVMENYPTNFTEAVLSRLLSNLETYHALSDLGMALPDLENKLDAEVLQGIDWLSRNQNSDGGWGWIQAKNSDDYISAYVLFGLSRAEAMDLFVDPQVILDAQTYLTGTLESPTFDLAPSELDQLVFKHFALQQSGLTDLGSQAIYEYRDKLDPWAKALLSVVLSTTNSNLSSDLLSALEAESQRTSSGAHWNALNEAQGYFSATFFNTSVSVYALARLDPQSVLLSDAVRYLVLNRRSSGGWGSSYDTAWVLLALIETLKSSGELDANFNYEALLNETQFLSGAAGNGESSVPVSIQMPLSDLLDGSNALLLRKDSESGRLYYRSFLQVYQPVENVEALEQGLSISRQIEWLGDDCAAGECGPLDKVQISSLKNPLQVRLVLTLPEPMNYLVVEDYIPAGAEILDRTLLTSQQGEGYEVQDRNSYLVWRNSWYFGQPQIYGDHVGWVAQNVPAGTYELTYQIVPFLEGEFRLIPAHAYQYYFPDVQASSAGGLIEFLP